MYRLHPATYFSSATLVLPSELGLACIMCTCVIAESKGEASNCDALSSCVCINIYIYVCIYVYMYIRPSQPETPKLCNSPVFTAVAHNKTLYLASISHKTAQHSTLLLHAAFILLLTSPIAPARATCTYKGEASNRALLSCICINIYMYICISDSTVVLSM